MRFVLPVCLLVVGLIAYSSGLIREIYKTQTREFKSNQKRTVTGIENNLSNQTLITSLGISQDSADEALEVLAQVKEVLSSDTIDMEEFSALYMRFEEIRPFVPAMEKIRPLMKGLRNSPEVCIVSTQCDEYDDDNCIDFGRFEEYQVPKILQFKAILITAIDRVSAFVTSASFQPSGKENILDCLLVMKDFIKEDVEDLIVPAWLQDCQVLIDSYKERPSPSALFIYTKSHGEGHHKFDPLILNLPQANKVCVGYFGHDQKELLYISEAEEDQDLKSTLKGLVGDTEYLLNELTYKQPYHSGNNDIQRALAVLGEFQAYLSQDRLDDDTFDHMEKQLQEIMLMVKTLEYDDSLDGYVMCIQISACNEYDNEECFANSDSAEFATSEQEKFKLLLKIAIERVEKLINRPEVSESQLKQSQKALKILREVMHHFDKTREEQRTLGFQDFYLPVITYPEKLDLFEILFYCMGPDQKDHMFDPIITRMLKKFPTYSSCIDVVELESVAKRIIK